MTHAASTRPTRRSKRTVLLWALSVAALLVVPTAAAGYRPVETDTMSVDSRTVTLLAPAVGEQPDGNLVGVTMSMEVTVRDGNGGVFVDTRPLTQVDMQGSARLAAGAAARLVGADFSAHDYYITMRSEAPTVGGPSAGATMALGFAALLAEVPLRDDVVMTGMINPDGSVGPVGGILEKAEAAWRAGADLFLIPEGQRIVRQVHREVDDSGWFPQVETTEERIDVVEHAEKEWGLEVREVSDIYAAFEAYTDHRLERPQPAEVRDTAVFTEVMGSASDAQLQAADARLGDLRSRLEDADLRDAPEVRDSLDARLSVVDERLGRAHAAQDNGSYYAASSLVFQSNIDLSVVELWLDALASDDERTWLADRGRFVSDQLGEARGRAVDAGPTGVSSLEAVGAAQVRLLEARRLMAQAEAAHDDDRLPDAIEALAFAQERLKSVDWWLGIATQLDERAERAELKAEPKALAADYMGFAQQALAYAEVLVGQVGVDPSLARLLNEARTAQADAFAALEDDLHAGALYSAMEVQAAAFGALSLVGSAELIDDRVERQRDAALVAVEEARNAGAEPFLAVSYLDFGDALRGDDDVSALLMFAQAATIASSSAALATGEGCGFVAAACDEKPVTITRTNVPGPDPWTAYLALATILLGFMAGILVTLVVRGARRDRDANHSAAGHQGGSGPGVPGHGTPRHSVHVHSSGAPTDPRPGAPVGRAQSPRRRRPALAAGGHGRPPVGDRHMPGTQPAHAEGARMGPGASTRRPSATRDRSAMARER